MLKLRRWALTRVQARLSATASSIRYLSVAPIGRRSLPCAARSTIAANGVPTPAICTEVGDTPTIGHQIFGAIARLADRAAVCERMRASGSHRYPVVELIPLGCTAVGTHIAPAVEKFLFRERFNDGREPVPGAPLQVSVQPPKMRIPSPIQAVVLGSCVAGTCTLVTGPEDLLTRLAHYGAGSLFFAHAAPPPEWLQAFDPVSREAIHASTDFLR